MARFEVSGIEAAQEAFLRRSERAAKAVPKMLKAGGAVLVKAEQEEIRRTFTSNRVTGDLANSIKCTAVKKRGSGQCVEVYPHGKNRRGERNATVGFVHQHARAPVVHAFAPEGNAGSSSGYAAGMGGRTGMIDTVDRLLKSTLDALCPNVARLFFRGKAGTYITYQLVSSEDMAAADDETHGTEYTYRVDIYSKRDYIALLRRVKQALKAAGFYGLVIDPEVYERDTGFYHVPIEAKYYEQTEV